MAAPNHEKQWGPDNDADQPDSHTTDIDEHTQDDSVFEEDWAEFKTGVDWPLTNQAEERPPIIIPAAPEDTTYRIIAGQDESPNTERIPGRLDPGRIRQKSDKNRTQRAPIIPSAVVEITGPVQEAVDPYIAPRNDSTDKLEIPESYRPKAPANTAPPVSQPEVTFDGPEEALKRAEGNPIRRNTPFFTSDSFHNGHGKKPKQSNHRLEIPANFMEENDTTTDQPTSEPPPSSAPISSESQRKCHPIVWLKKEIADHKDRKEIPENDPTRIVKDVIEEISAISRPEGMLYADWLAIKLALVNNTPLSETGYIIGGNCNDKGPGSLLALSVAEEKNWRRTASESTPGQILIKPDSDFIKLANNLIKLLTKTLRTQKNEEPDSESEPT